MDLRRFCWKGTSLLPPEARAGFRAALGVGRGLRWRRGVKVTWAGVLRSPPADFQAGCWNNDRCLFCSPSEPGARVWARLGWFCGHVDSAFPPWLVKFGHVPSLL